MTEQEAIELIESINLEQLKEYAQLIVIGGKSMIDVSLVNKATEDVFQFAAHELKSLLAKREIAKLEARSQTLNPKSSTLLLQIEIKAQGLVGCVISEDTTIISPVIGYSENQFTQRWELNPKTPCFIDPWRDYDRDFCRLRLTKEKQSGAIYLEARSIAKDVALPIQISSVDAIDYSFPIPEM